MCVWGNVLRKVRVSPMMICRWCVFRVSVGACVGKCAQEGQGAAYDDLQVVCFESVCGCVCGEMCSGRSGCRLCGSLPSTIALQSGVRTSGLHALSGVQRDVPMAAGNAIACESCTDATKVRGGRSCVSAGTVSSEVV